MKTILLIGATSAIAEATARIYAKRGDKLYLIARNKERLRAIASDLKIRGAESVGTSVFDVNNFAKHADVLNTAWKNLGNFDIVVLAHGTLPLQEGCQRDAVACYQELHTNAVSTAVLLTYISNKLESQRRGTIAVITSVAGVRGRQSNYVYGAAKAMVSVFLQGLRNRLHKANVKVLDIKPGFVDTPMTAHLKKGLLWAKPESIALGIVKAIEKEKNEVYLPWFWKFIMLIIKNIPEAIFKRLSL